MTEITTEVQEGRTERLRARLASVRARGAGIPAERIVALIGAALVGIGIPLIILGWYGAAHTPYTFEQIPYMISGGILGLALVVLGGLFYFAYWMTRQVHETRLQSDRTEAVFQRMEELLSSNGHGTKGEVAPAAASGTFVTTARGTMFHKPDCVVVKGRKDLKRVSADAPGLKPCKICDPLGEVAAAE